MKRKCNNEFSHLLRDQLCMHKGRLAGSAVFEVGASGEDSATRQQVARK
jgi:hypothetical protein